MKDKKQNKNASEHADDPDKELNANSAYSGSGSMQPSGGDGKAGKLNDFQEDNLDETESAKEQNAKDDEAEK